MDNNKRDRLMLQSTPLIHLQYAPAIPALRMMRRNPISLLILRSSRI